MRERTAYALLAIVFAASRLAYYLVGVRFDARPVLTYYQFIDPELLKHRLFESLLYLHIQPPGWNLYLGAVLKAFPNSYPAAFRLLYLILGLGIGWLTYYLMRACRVSQGLAFGLSAWFVVSPGTILFENYLLYEYLITFLLLAAAAALFRFASNARALPLIAFFAALLALVYVRNFFHLFYFAAIMAALAFLFRRDRRLILVSGALPLAAILALYAKNWILFDSFTGSTWMGMNMNTITIHQLTEKEAQDFVQRGVTLPASLIEFGSPIKSYRPYIVTPARTGIPVLDDCRTSTGAANFNCLAYRQVQQIYTRDGLALLRKYPVVLLRSIVTGCFTYFLPATDYPFFDLNRPKLHALDRFWNIVFFGQFREAADRKELRRLAAQGARSSLVLYTGVFLMIGMPALWLWGAYYLWTSVRRSTLNMAAAILIGFMLLNIAYVTAIANLLSAFENNRYRFPLDPFYLALFGIALTKAQQRLRVGWLQVRSHSHPAGQLRNKECDSASLEL